MYVPWHGMPMAFHKICILGLTCNYNSFTPLTFHGTRGPDYHFIGKALPSFEPHGIPWNFHVFAHVKSPWFTLPRHSVNTIDSYHGIFMENRGNNMNIPWNYVVWTMGLHGMSMEFSYVYAHMKSTWFAYHRHSMKYHGFRPWYFHAKAMEITWTFHWIMVVGTHGILWNLHGIFICFCPHEITMVYIPWIFHGIPWIKSMVFPWNYHGLDLIAFHGICLLYTSPSPRD